MLPVLAIAFLFPSLLGIVSICFSWHEDQWLHLAFCAQRSPLTVIMPSSMATFQFLPYWMSLKCKILLVAYSFIKIKLSFLGLHSTSPFWFPFSPTFSFLLFIMKFFWFVYLLNDGIVLSVLFGPCSSYVHSYW